MNRSIGVVVAKVLRMKLIRNRVVMTSFLLTIFVMLISNYAQAQLMCAELFQKQPSLSESNELKALKNFSETFIRNIQYNPAKLTVNSVDSGFRLLERISEDYFKRAQIDFVKVPRSIEVKNLKDKESFVFQYTGYKLKGSADGDEIARLINGVQTNPKLKDFPVAFVFDPLLALSYPGHGANFSWWQKLTIRFGPNAVLNTNKGENSFLRHEIQHYFEVIKLLSGQMTLSRIKLSNDQTDLSDTNVNGTHLTADEAEAYLRDSRYSLSRIKAGDNRGSYPSAFQGNMILIRGFIKNIRKNISQAEHALVLGQREYLIEEDGKLVVNFLNPVADKDGYKKTKFILNGLISVEDFKDTSKADAVVSHIFTWSRQRLLEIEKELQ